MKNFTLYIQVLLTLFLISIQNEIFSQNDFNNKTKKPGLFLGFSAGPSQSQINEVIAVGSGLQSDKANTFFGSAEIGYFFSKYFGLSSGVGFNSYKTQLTLGSYSSQFNTTDSENESYQRQVTGTNIKEVQEIGFLCVPINLIIRIPFSKTFGFFFQPGINLAVPLSKNYTSSGTFTFKGYYPAYNVLIENLPAYGFPSNVNSSSKGELEIKSSNINAMASAGFDFFIQKKIQIEVGAFYSKSLSNISGYTSPDTFRLSSDVNQINSFMGESNKVSLESMGILISLRYYLK